MSSPTPAAFSLSTSQDATLHLLKLLEGIKSAATYCTYQAIQASEISDDLYLAREEKLHLHRNDLVDAWRKIADRIDHPLVKERINDTSRELSLLCKTLDNKGKASTSDKAFLGAAAIASRFSFGSFLTSWVGEDTLAPTKKEFPPLFVLASKKPKSFTKWHFDHLETPASTKPLIITPIPELPLFDLTPNENKDELFTGICTYWKQLKPIAFENIHSILQEKIRTTFIIHTRYIRTEAEWKNQTDNLALAEKSLPLLESFQNTVIKTTDLFHSAYLQWYTISRFESIGLETNRKASVIADTYSNNFLKLASIKIRLISLTKLYFDRTRRLKEELSKS